MTVRMPKRNSHAEKLMRVLYEHQSLTVDEGIEIHKNFGERRSATKRVYDAAVNSKWLIKDGEAYSLSPEARAEMGGAAPQDKSGSPVGTIVPPRTRNVFATELKGYADRMTKGLREPIREISFLGASQ